MKRVETRDGEALYVNPAHVVCVELERHGGVSGSDIVCISLVDGTMIHCDGTLEDVAQMLE